MERFNLWLKNILGETSKKIICKILYPCRNKFILFNIFNKAHSGQVNLNYWSESKNLGDAIAPLIIEHMLKDKIESKKSSTGNTEHLFAVGSVITAGIQDGTVWGSGVLNPKLLYRLNKRKLDIRAVRGPITRALLLEHGYQVPEVYGDPGIFLPDIYNPSDVKKRAKYGMIMHKDDTRINIGLDKIDEYIIIDIKTDDYQQFIRDIKSVEIVVASSLHGIILAEAYGIPAILFKPQVDFMKYYDYYFSTGRTDIPIIETFNDIEGIKPLKVPDFTQMKSKLEQSFPYDIYEGLENRC